MSYFSEMEWNSNWDWESFKKNHWITVDEAIGPSSFNMSGPGGSSGTSTKSSISVSGNSPLPEGSIGSMEPMISLELGERTYFENNSTSSVMPNPSATTAPKKLRSSSQNAPIPRCQVEGCNLDLSTAKEYHRKHRVCDGHSKCSKVVIKGLERRFCQQCSRFHSLSEFDDKKRSCRRRLSDHNARRRKPHQESNQFNSTKLSSPFYGGRQQVSFLLNNAPYLHSKTPAAYSSWDSESNSKFTLTKGYPSSTNGDGLVTDDQFHMPSFKTPHIINNGLLPSKNSSSEFLYPGTNGSLISSSNLDAATSNEYRCVLSLLSKKSWGSGSSNPETIQVQQHPMQGIGTSIVQPMMMNGIPEGLPLSSTDFWLSGQNPIPNLHVQTTDTSFQEFAKPPYESDFYSNM